MNVFALLTGRGNNALNNKNILPVLGLPLLSYPAMAAAKVIAHENLYASSDDIKILEAAAVYGFQEILRPEELSAPDSQHIDAILHALDFLEKTKNKKPDILVVLLANSGTIKHEWILEGIQQIQNDPRITAVVPVYQEQDHHPYRAKKLNKDGFLETYFDFSHESISTNRQDLRPNYFISHNFWVLNVKRSILSNKGQQPWNFMGNNVKPIIVEGCFDVHTIADLERTETWIKKNL